MLAIPFAKPFQALDLLLWDGAIGHGPDIKEEIATTGNTLDEIPDNMGRGFVVFIRAVVAPVIVHCHAELPRAFGCHGGYALLGRFVVAVALHAGIEDDMGAPCMEEIAQLFHAPLLGGAVPVTIEPEEVGAKFFAKLTQLSAIELKETLPGYGVVFAEVEAVGACGISVVTGRNVLGQRGVVWMRPVKMAKVEADFEAFLPKGCHIGGDEVSCGRGGLYGVEVAGRSIPQSEAVMVLCGEHGVAGTSSLEEGCPRLWVVFGGGEAVALGHVVFMGNLPKEKGPRLACGLYGVNAPVNEDAKFGVFEPGRKHSGN